MISKELPRYARMSVEELSQSKEDFTYMEYYANTAPLLTECPNLPVDLKEFSKAYLYEASRNLEYWVKFHEREGLKHFDAHFTNAPKNYLISMINNLVPGKLKETELFKKYASAMGAAFFTIDDMLGLSCACEALGLNDQREVADKEMERRFNLDQERVSLGQKSGSYFMERIKEFHTLENFEKSIRFLKEYVEEFRKSDLYNFDLKAYLEDQKRQWIEYRENQEKTGDGK